MRVKIRPVLALAALGALLSAGSASAATICVNPTGTAPCKKINKAIFDASPGDTIAVAPGVYSGSALNDENDATQGYVWVGSGKDSLKILPSSGVVIIDPEIGTGLGWAGFYINSNGVGLTSMTVRNSKSYGIYVYTGKTGFTMTNMKVLGPNDTCVWLNGGNTGTKISGSTFRGCDYGIRYDNADSDNVSILSNTFEFVSNAIYGGGAAPVITGNKIGPTSSYGIYVYDADGGNVSFNTLFQTGSDGIDIFGGAGPVTVSANKITNTGSWGLWTDVDGAIVTSNVVTNPNGTGIYPYGSNLQVKSNVVTSSYGSGIYVYQGGASNKSDNAVVSGNRPSPYPGGDGIDFYYGNNAMITSNVATLGYHGVYFDGGDQPTITGNVTTTAQGGGVHAYCYNYAASTACTGGKVASNTLTDGSDGEDGFYIDTSTYGPATATFTLSGNVATRAGWHCFELLGNKITATGNKGFDCGEYAHEGSYKNDGFYVEGKEHTLTSNVIFRAAQDGYFLNTTDTSTTTTLTGNFSGNAGEDGFDIHGSKVTLFGNTAASSNGVGFEVNNVDKNAAGITGVQFTGSNTAGASNALGACFSGSTTSVSGTNSFGTPANPSACSEAAGYIGN